MLRNYSKRVSGFLALTNKRCILVMLSSTTKKNILYDEFYYSQIDGVAMGSSNVGNLFLCHHATKWLKNFPEGFKPIFYKRHVYDIFVLFEKSEQVLPFNHLIKKHNYINFPFLFSKLSVYRKDTFSLSYDISNSADS